MVKFSVKKKSNNSTFLHILFAVMNICGIGQHEAFYVVIFTFSGEGQVWAKNIE